ncbi:hypothetical protein NPIL_314601 [Nephila pilipes]|uniref:Uncharacterized protein n=1 Tax=Nephila pilipes TaxID=299642 RepID=A0A8X6PHC5_NEPPI|nr:hypothetical protein NPIL_314601 [Nephila pilipes]
MRATGGRAALCASQRARTACGDVWRSFAAAVLPGHASRALRQRRFTASGRSGKRYCRYSLQPARTAQFAFFACAPWRSILRRRSGSVANKSVVDPVYSYQKIPLNPFKTELRSIAKRILVSERPAVPGKGAIFPERNFS